MTHDNHFAFEAVLENEKNIKRMGRITKTKKNDYLCEQGVRKNVSL